MWNLTFCYNVEKMFTISSAITWKLTLLSLKDNTIHVQQDNRFPVQHIRKNLLIFRALHDYRDLIKIKLS